ncbi:MAG: ferritin-like domain-containing protein [Rubrobacteraceae bacterium]|uniref:ferritin-like domain-containing protein n=1 Tax=Rubrobacter naiadicus TaxID=1392641 RepID=UPI002361A49A|nr:ferritin-like domain-containing protein [Rubrobacter naiadicus]MBX6762664.1 ferritin-like domain-containing protein [Rubrobacteraceae bacterium]MCL6438537.1 ferritin-like domain-containing protein [Rubrobacteraceae bacterium]
MKEQTGTEAAVLEGTRSRRDFFKLAGLAGAGAVMGSVALAPKAFAQGTSNYGSDLDIANFALTLEYLEATFYENAVDSGVLSGDALKVVTALRDHEQAHVDALISLIKSAGGTPVSKPQFTFPSGATSSESSILNLAATFEPVGVGAYLGAAPAIQSPDVLAAAGSIAGVEGEHVVAVNNLLGNAAATLEAFPAALTKDEVLAKIAPFLGMGSMMNTGGGSRRDWYRNAHV